MSSSLDGLSAKELRQKCVEAGVPADQIELARDSNDQKAALRALIPSPVVQPAEVEPIFPPVAQPMPPQQQMVVQQPMVAQQPVMVQQPMMVQQPIVQQTTTVINVPSGATDDKRSGNSYVNIKLPEATDLCMWLACCCNKCSIYTKCPECIGCMSLSECLCVKTAWNCRL